MFSRSLFCGVAGLMLAFSAQATLFGDYIDGTGTGISDFDASGVLVGASIEFEGSLVIGASGQEFDALFDFDDSTGVDILSFLIESSDGSDVADTVDFSVTFSDLNWDGEPNRILTGLNVIKDEPYDSDGAGLSGTVSDHAFTLNFTDFFIQEFRELEIELLTTIDSTSSNPDPVPVPPALGLGLMGMGLVGLTRRSRQNNKKV